MTGQVSPYPTVVTVVRAHQRASPPVLMVAPGAPRSTSTISIVLKSTMTKATPGRASSFSFSEVPCVRVLSFFRIRMSRMKR